MKKLMKRMMGILAALSLLVAATAVTSATADAATATSYTWEYTTDNGATWKTVPADMKVAIASIDYDGTDLTITSAGEVLIRGVAGEIVTIQQMNSSATLIGDNILGPDGTAVIEDVSAPFYVYFDIELATGYHSAVYTRITNLTF